MDVLLAGLVGLEETLELGSGVGDDLGHGVEGVFHFEGVDFEDGEVGRYLHLVLGIELVEVSLLRHLGGGHVRVQRMIAFPFFLGN